jgi:hypothetical protein
LKGLGEENKVSALLKTAGAKVDEHVLAGFDVVWDGVVHLNQSDFCHTDILLRVLRSVYHTQRQSVYRFFWIEMAFLYISHIPPNYYSGRHERKNYHQTPLQKGFCGVFP